MKAVVMEIKGIKAITLSEDGTFTNIKNKGYSIGQSIEVEENRMKKMSRKYRNIAVGIAASMVILLGGGSAYAYNTPVAQVSLDVNPSVSYSVNSFGIVIQSTLNNEEAKNVLETVVWDGKDIEQVIGDTIAALKHSRYLNNEKWYEDGLIIGVNAINEDKEAELILAIKNELAEIVAAETNKTIDEKELGNVVVGIGAERVAEAIKLSNDLQITVTPGKLNLVQKLGDDYQTMTTDEAIVLFKRQVKDIMAEVKANRLGITYEAIDANLTEDDLEINDKANENANENATKIKNGNKGQNDVTDGAIETDND